MAPWGRAPSSKRRKLSFLHHGQAEESSHWLSIPDSEGLGDLCLSWVVQLSYRTTRKNCAINEVAFGGSRYTWYFSKERKTFFFSIPTLGPFLAKNILSQPGHMPARSTRGNHSDINWKTNVSKAMPSPWAWLSWAESWALGKPERSPDSHGGSSGTYWFCSLHQGFFKIGSCHQLWNLKTPPGHKP